MLYPKKRFMSDKTLYNLARMGGKSQAVLIWTLTQSRLPTIITYPLYLDKVCRFTNKTGE